MVLLNDGEGVVKFRPGQVIPAKPKIVQPEVVPVSPVIPIPEPPVKESEPAIVPQPVETPKPKIQIKNNNTVSDEVKTTVRPNFDFPPRPFDITKYQV